MEPFEESALFGPAFARGGRKRGVVIFKCEPNRCRLVKWSQITQQLFYAKYWLLVICGCHTAKAALIASSNSEGHT